MWTLFPADSHCADQDLRSPDREYDGSSAVSRDSRGGQVCCAFELSTVPAAVAGRRSGWLRMSVLAGLPGRLGGRGGLCHVVDSCRTALHVLARLSNVRPQLHRSSTTSPLRLSQLRRSRDRRVMTDHVPAPRPFDEPPLLHLRTVTDFVEAIPYLLGFHPTESLVVVMLHGPHDRVGVTLRYDLPKICGVPTMAREIAAHASLHGGDRAVVVVFAERQPRADEVAEWSLVGHVSAALGRAGVAVADSLHVSGGSWRSYLCNDPECCPSEGRPLPTPGTMSDLAVAAADAGLVALPDRNALQARLAPAEGSARASMERALAAAEAAFVQAAASDGIPVWRAAMQSRIERALTCTLAVDRGPGPSALTHSGPPALTDEEAAEILVALSDTAVRDTWWLKAEDSGSGDCLALWSGLVQRAVPPYDAAPLFLLAWTAWRHGDGALARMAAERALSSDPDYQAASLLLDAMDLSVDPRCLPSLAASMRGNESAATGDER
jgi:Domain of unknown function (DUF4192)